MLATGIDETRPLGLADLELPYPSARNPSGRATGETAKALARSTGILQPGQEKFFDEFTDLAARFYPSAPAEGLVLGELLVSWLFFLDDSYDRDAGFASDIHQVQRLMRECLSVLAGGALPAEASPLHRYTRIFHEHLRRAAGPEWLARFGRSVSDYLLQGSLETVQGWRETSTLDIAAYMERRVLDSGVMPCIDLIEPLGGFSLPPEVVTSRGVQQLRRLCARVIAYANDLVSYEAEVIDRNKPNNLVRLLMNARHCSFESAVTACVELINRDARGFTRLSWRLPRYGGALDDALHRYIQGMGALMRGNLDWSLSSRRYRSPGSPFAELREPLH